jgi:hypothetical protein
MGKFLPAAKPLSDTDLREITQILVHVVPGSLPSTLDQVEGKL